MTGHSLLAATAALLSAFALAGCNDEKAPAEAIPDITYAAWGAAPDKTHVGVIDQHDRNGAVVKRIHVSVTPHIVSDCTASADIAIVQENVATGAKDSDPGESVIVDYRLAAGLTSEYVVLPDEAALFKDPNNKPAFTPQKVLLTHFRGLGAVCKTPVDCLGTDGVVSMFTDPTITVDSLVAAFNRMKAKCPLPAVP